MNKEVNENKKCKLDITSQLDMLLQQANYQNMSVNTWLLTIILNLAQIMKTGAKTREGHEENPKIGDGMI